jgi:hypothetical protein
MCAGEVIAQQLTLERQEAERGPILELQAAHEPAETRKVVLHRADLRGSPKRDSRFFQRGLWEAARGKRLPCDNLGRKVGGR